jgi:drug/metabolite transporter (DMT)-like permease
MSRASFVRLFALAALWGGSFLFIRVAAHALPPPLLMFARVSLAALVLVMFAGVPRFTRHTARHFLVVGVLNSAVPFVLIAFAAKTLGAGVCSILNASSPVFAALFGALLSRTVPSARVMTGLAVGLAGVAVTASATFGAGLDHVDAQRALLAVSASLAAAVSYGIAAVYTKRANVDVKPIDTATGSMIGAAIVLAIPAALAAPPTTFSGNALLATGALAIACTALGYALYFRILADEGATAALSVTFLVPIFGVLWSALCLDEPIAVRVVAGAACVLFGTLIANVSSGTNAANAARRALLSRFVARAKVMP